MQRYEIGCRVEASAARQDRIGLQLGTWRIQGLDVHLREYILSLRQQSDVQGIQAARPPLNGEAEYTPGWFSAPRGHANAPQLPFRGEGQGSGIRSGRPLIAGHIKFIPASPLAEDGAIDWSAWRATAHLILNPTRFVAHQVMPHFWNAPPDHWTALNPAELEPARMVTTRPTLRIPDEVVLDGNDNVLLARRRRRLGNPAAWRCYTRLHWRSIVRLMHSLMLSAGQPNANLQVSFQPSLNLEIVETYWEFAVADPLTFIRAIQPCILAQGQRPQARHHGFPSGFSVAGSEGGALSLKIRLRPGVYLVVYAKTSGRVRFEVRHKLTENADALGGSHTADGDLDTFHLWIDRLAEDAADRLNLVLADLDRHLSPPPIGQPLWRLIASVHQVADGQQQADLMLSLLANKDAIRLGPKDPLRDVVKALERAGILRRPQAKRQIYVATPEYRRAIDRLRGGTGEMLAWSSFG